MIPLPVGLEPVGKQDSVGLDCHNPAVCAGLEYELATVANGSAGKRKVFHTFIDTPWRFSIV